MNIGIDAKVLAKRKTGIGIYVEQLIRYFNEIDHEDQFFLFTTAPFQLEFPINENFRQVVVHPKLKSLGIIFGMEKYIDQYHIDVFWGTEHIIPWTKSCRTVVTIHDLAVLMNPKLGTRKNALIQRLFTIPSCRKADKVIAISKATKNDVVKLCGVSDNKVAVIYNGGSPYNEHQHKFTQQEENEIKNKFRLDEKYFLFVSTIEPRKNVPTIVSAYNLFRKDNKENRSKLVLAGGLGWRYEKSLKAIEQSPYKEDIIMTGYCSDLEREYLYTNAVALLFPSLYEGLGLPIIEAMSVGTPVITARNSSLTEVGGEVAFFIDEATDDKALEKMLEEVCSLSDDKRSVLASQCKAWAKHFSRKYCAEKTLELLKNI